MRSLPLGLCHLAPTKTSRPLIKVTDGAEAVCRVRELLLRKKEDLAMMDFDMERLIGETMAEVLRERLIVLRPGFETSGYACLGGQG
jgi:hypothetical protein